MKLIISILVIIVAVIFFNDGIENSFEKLGYEKISDNIKTDIATWDDNMTVSTKYKIIDDSVTIKAKICATNDVWDKINKYLNTLAYPKFSGVTYNIKDKDMFVLGKLTLYYQSSSKRENNCIFYNEVKELNIKNPVLSKTAHTISISHRDGKI